MNTLFPSYIRFFSTLLSLAFLYRIRESMDVEDSTGFLIINLLSGGIAIWGFFPQISLLFSSVVLIFKKIIFLLARNGFLNPPDDKKTFIKKIKGALFLARKEDALTNEYEIQSFVVEFCLIPGFESITIYAKSFHRPDLRFVDFWVTVKTSISTHIVYDLPSPQRVREKNS